ncbi:MAG: DNA/RNA non-specific endonuclease [Chloroherpetonaceae bacterium]|nr:DNA/RNA non-specific endonuclease [Chloroherpetonaceae bacterium]
MFKRITKIALACLMAFLIASCSDNTLAPVDSVSPGLENGISTNALTTGTVTEGFENGSKTSYASGNVTLTSGVWLLTDALIGTSTSDRFAGTRSVRIVNSGIVRMTFDRISGAGTVSIKHAKYGSDANSSWELWASTNSGTSWVKVGSTVATSSTTLSTATFTANISGTVRFEIRKVSGGSARINIDDITITDYSSGGGSGSGGEIEPNNSTSQAQSLTLPTTFTGFISSASDVDYFRFTGNSGQSVSISLTVPSTVDYDLYLLNASGSVISRSELGTGTRESISSTLSTSGTYYVYVNSYSGSSASSGYSLSVSLSTSGGGWTLPPLPSSVHLYMGNPSNASTTTSTPTNYLMVKSQYTLSYHRDKGIPNWVAWHVDNTWLGSAQRQDDFRNDATLPTGWYQVGGNSYSGSGFDRGHNCPSADRTSTTANNSATFLMTNMIPQSPDNNQGPWANLENYTRTLVAQGNECYVIMGQYGTGGTGSSGFKTTIDGGRVTVPNRVWKVIIVIPAASGDDATRVTNSTRVIAVDMPNSQGIRNNSWGTYRTTVDAIEQASGVDIMSRVSPTIQAVLESKVDNGPTL